MKHIPILFSTLSLLVASTAMATEPTSARLGGAAAIDFNEPQDNRFGPGAGGALKVTFDLAPWLDVAPSVMTDQFAPNPAYSATGVSGLWAYGVGLRVKRPHNANDGSIWASSSPWVDGDLQVVDTGGLARFGYSLGAGIAGPLDEARHAWLGPYVRWTEVVDGTQFGGNAKLDHTDASMVQFGLELEWDFAGVKKAAPPAPVAQVPSRPAVDQLRTPKTPDALPDINLEEKDHLDTVVQFAFDKADLTDASKGQLDELAQQALTSIQAATTGTKAFSLAIEVDGYASSENHPNKEAYNQALSQKRADTVKAYLVSKGVPAEDLTAKGFGTANPVAPNDTEAHRKFNRRVEFGVDIKVTMSAPQGGSK
jgi:outer membrane protein OmpA-like peptidoglycan-associated protein